MKRSNLTSHDKVKIRAACVFTIVTLGAFVFFILHLPYHDLFLFFSPEKYFWFNGKVIALACTSPLFIYVILYSFLSLFSTNAEPPKAYQKYATIVAVFFFSLFILLNMLSLLLYLYIAMFTPFKSCQDPRLKEYYVTDYHLCSKVKAPEIF